MFRLFLRAEYHPAFQHIGAARKLCAERGQRTLFNFLGPLLNPARPSAQLVGCPARNSAKQWPRAAIPRRAPWHGGVRQAQTPRPAHLDELSTLAKTRWRSFIRPTGSTVHAPAGEFSGSTRHVVDLAAAIAWPTLKSSGRILARDEPARSATRSC